MGASSRPFHPRIKDHPTEPAPETPPHIDNLLAPGRIVNLKEICESTGFVAVLLLIPESGVDPQTFEPLSEPPDLAKNFRVLSKTMKPGRTPNAQGEFLFGQIKVNFLEMSVCRDGQPVRLTAMEFKVLGYLMRNSKRVISRVELLNEVWGYEDYPRTRTVDNHVLRLRQKLEQSPSQPVHIRTVRGAGYQFLP